MISENLCENPRNLWITYRLFTSSSWYNLRADRRARNQRPVWRTRSTTRVPRSVAMRAMNFEKSIAAL